MQPVVLLVLFKIFVALHRTHKIADYRVRTQLISSTISSPKMAFEYRLTWLEQPAEKVKFREQAHTYKCQNQELLLGWVGTFWIFLIFHVRYSTLLHLPPLSRSLCRRILRDRTQDSWDYGIGCQTL